MRNKNFHSWRIATINTCTGKDDQKIERVIHEIAKAKLSLCCLLEIPCLNNNSVIIAKKKSNVDRKHKLCWSDHVAKRQQRVGIAIKVDKGIEIEEIIPVRGKIIVANVLLYGCSLQVICCYAPTEEDSDSSKNIFYNKLTKEFECENIRKIMSLRFQYLLVSFLEQFVPLRKYNG